MPGTEESMGTGREEDEEEGINGGLRKRCEQEVGQEDGCNKNKRTMDTFHWTVLQIQFHPMDVTEMN